MEVKTFTYKKMLGTFYLQKMFSSKKMDDHIAEMLKDGWEIISTTNHPDSITMTYKKD